MAEIPGVPPMGPVGPEGLPGDENARRAFREREERQGGIPINAPDILEDLQRVEIGENGDISELKEAVENALAVTSGLEFGVDGDPYEFDPDNPHDRHKIAYLQNKFTTVESAMGRPETAGYIRIALNEAVAGRIRRVRDYDKNPAKHLTRIQRNFDTVNRMLMENGQRPLPREELERQQNETREKFDRERAALPALIELNNNIHSREIYDQAFLYRMNTCEDPKSAAGLGIEIKTVTPDAGHWVGYFQSEHLNDFQERVDAVFEEIVKFGLDDSVIQRLGMTPIPRAVRDRVKSDIYATGFNSGVTFGVWFKHLYEVSGQRADIVWEAWKLAETTEVVDATLGKTINTKGKIVLATPPIGNALFSFIAHMEDKRMLEYGMKANISRDQIEKFISHSGLPMSIDKIPNLCLDYFHESKIELNATQIADYGTVIDTMLEHFPHEGHSDYDPRFKELTKNIEDVRKKPKNDDGTENTVEIPLWDIWLYGRLKFSDKNFPWFQTDQPDPDTAPGELPSGSFGGWFLKRFRSNSVLEDIRSRPALQELTDPDFFVKRLRNWTKVLGKTKEKTAPEDNPRMWWVAGLVYYHYTRPPQEWIKGNRDFRNLYKTQMLELRDVGTSDKLSIKDFLANAVACGFLRQIDVDWIVKNIGG